MKSRSKPISAEAALSGQIVPTVEDLFQLIHEVNPTGRRRSADESRERYGQKSRLQSLLIRLYGDAVLVEEDSSNPSLVTLRHRFSRSDACHAVVDELDRDAQRWVRNALNHNFK